MTRRPGVTLVELIVALAIFSVLLTTTLSFYRQQGAAFTEGNDRMAVMQNLRYGVNTVEQNARTAGIGVPTKQPVIVYASENVLAFNADYATNRSNEFFAVFYDRLLPDDAVTAVTPARRFTIPGTTFQYPDSSYYQGSSNSPAETISFYFEPDTSTTRTDDFALFRQVNDQGADVVARRLLRADGQPFFTFYQVADSAAGSPIAAISDASLPTAHYAPIHGSVADTGALSLVDSIRAVRVTYAATNGLTGSDENMRTITRLIRLPNAGVETQPNCGNKPLLGTALTATAVDQTLTQSGHVLLQWNQAIDEISGEQDVLRYVIWRRVGSSGAWGDPLVSISPGSSTYAYEDHATLPATTYTYGLAAQDCTPQYSDLAVSAAVSWQDNS